MITYYLIFQLIFVILTFTNVINVLLITFLPLILLTTQISIMFIMDYTIFSIFRKKEKIKPLTETKKEIAKKFIPKTIYTKIKPMKYEEKNSIKIKKRTFYKS